MQPDTFFIHCAVAQAYRSPGSVGAFFRSLSLMLYFADAPADIDFMPFFVDGGVPAVDVPQYWHRAAGLDVILIAHAESRQRVKFACEHFDAACACEHSRTADIKVNICFFIFSLVGNYIKNVVWVQREF